MSIEGEQIMSVDQDGKRLLHSGVTETEKRTKIVNLGEVMGNKPR